MSALLTQQQLADKIGLSRGSVANIETGRQQMLLHQLRDIARAPPLRDGVAEWMSERGLAVCEAERNGERIAAEIISAAIRSGEGE